jgi:hypothetical protein
MASLTTNNDNMSPEEAAALRASDIERLKAAIAAGDDAAADPGYSSPSLDTNKTTSEEKKQTPEEQAASLQWLRDHGIEVETPEDRENARDLAASMSTLRATDPDTRTFTYVHIPADSSIPLKEMTAVVYSDKRGAGDQLLSLLKSNFAAGTVDKDALRRVAESTHLGNQESSSALNNVTPASIASGGGSVETFRLADQVSLYLDGVGALKALPPNARAVQLASQCGYGDVPLFGDMYVGRRTSDRNEDFTLNDVDVNSQWLKEAVVQNLERQKVESQFRGGGMTADELNAKGGKGEGYTWKQTPEDVEISVPLPEGTRGKQCKVQFGNRSCKIVVQNGINLNFKTLYGKIRADDSLWTIEDGILVVTMEKGKAKEVWPTVDA